MGDTNWDKNKWIKYAEEVASIGFEEIKWIKYAKERLNKENPVLADVGANLGDYTSEFLKIFPNAECYCFEPVTEIFNKLKKRLGIDNPKIHYFNYGLFNKKSETEFYHLLEDEDCGMSSIYYREEVFSEYSNKKILVDLYKFDDIFETMKPIDFIKIDTEGSELMILEGAKRLFEVQPPSFVQWEYGGCYLESKSLGKDVIMFFESRGYKTFNKYSDEKITSANFREDFGVLNYFSIREDY